MSDVFLSRVSVSHQASAQTITSLFLKLQHSWDQKKEKGEQALISHSLLWSLFSDDPDRKRDFLWCQTGEGSYLVLSNRPPEDKHALFDVESKLFKPLLSEGDKLQFRLYANATVSRKRPDSSLQDGKQNSQRKRGVRCDIVMDSLYKIPKKERANVREELTYKAASLWLSKQSEEAGFKLTENFTVNACDVLRIPREKDRSGKGFATATFGVVDLTGIIQVTEPEAFLKKICNGFGRAKAFGCGLMLIRRAS